MVHFLDLGQLVGKWLEHQALHRLGHGAGIGQRDHARTVRKARVLLARHGQIGGDAEQAEHHHDQPDQPRPLQQADHGSSSTGSRSARRVSPA